jgi:glutamate synthase domain-containing protein 2
MGADVCNAARAMLFSIGCIQAQKCNTNTCPTGVTTQDPRLMAGLHVPTKAERAFKYHEKTVHVALEITGALGYENAAMISGRDIIRRTPSDGLRSFNEICELFCRYLSLPLPINSTRRLHTFFPILQTRG